MTKKSLIKLIIRLWAFIENGTTDQSEFFKLREEVREVLND